MDKMFQNSVSLLLERKTIISGLVDKKNGSMDLRESNQHMTKTW